MIVDVYQVSKGKYKGLLVVKTTNEMPTKVHVRGLKPLPTMQLIGFSRLDGLVRSSNKTAYPAFNVHMTYLVRVGQVNVPKFFPDPNGMPKQGINGFYLLDRYGGKSRDQVVQLIKSESRAAADYSVCVDKIK